MFVWGGTESVYIDWVAMDDDLSLADLNPATRSGGGAYSYTNSYGEASSGGGMASAPMKRGDNYVLWLNVSGFRGDYVEDAETPFLDSTGGSTSDSLIPVFPTIRFPSLISQATGVLPSVHGVVGDTMRHPETKDIERYPTALAYLKAEPIWTTAKRQGMSVLVHDWPFSQEQPAEHAADVYLSEYDEGRSDEDRLNALLDAWSSHQGEQKIRLAMASLQDLNTAAREHGPKEPDTLTAVTTLDSTLKTFFEKLEAKWPELSNEGDKLYVAITTDHGSANSDKLINYGELMGKLGDQVTYAVSDGVAHLWFKDLPEGVDREDFEEGYDGELKKRIYWRSYAKGDYPSTWGLGKDGGGMFGDRFLVLKPGYAFTTETGSEPVFDPSEAGGPFAASGYAVSDSSRMKGQAFFFRLDGGGGSDLGEIQGTQLHSTICSLLKIQPAEGAEAKALDVE